MMHHPDVRPGVIGCAIPLLIGERVDRLKAETGEGELSTLADAAIRAQFSWPSRLKSLRRSDLPCGAASKPLIRRDAPPSPRWGEEQGWRPLRAEEHTHV